MRISIKFLAMFVMILFFSNSVKFDSYAQEIQEYTPETVAVSLVIDTSGSMMANDPENLRSTASELFIDLLSPDDYLGIITFDTKATEVLPLQKVSNTNNKIEFKEKLIPYLVAKGDTNYKIALEEAASQLSSVTDPNVRKVIIFITDGAPDPDSARSQDEVFMSQYMESLWESVGELSKQQYAVYSVGFSENIRKDILSQIAAETNGDFIILPDASALAASSFQILGELKNRKGFIDKTVELSENVSFDFVIDEYTTQATMVVVKKEDSQYEIEVIDPNGVAANASVLFVPTDKYTIIIANNSGELINGKWKVTINGNGAVDIFGDRDLNIKSWLTEPTSASHYQNKEPVAIKVNVTGKLKQGISVQATIWHNGIVDNDVILLSESNGIYQGSYTKLKQQGIYSIKIDVLLNGEIITTQQKEFKVGIVPDLNYQFQPKADGYRVGEKIPVSAWMSLGTTRLKQGGDLNIDNCYIEIINENNEITSQNLKDNGTGQTGDANRNDGVWSGVISLDKITQSAVSLIISGSYKNERFMIRKELDRYVVKEPGTVFIDFPYQKFINTYQTQLLIPITITNQSVFEESIHFQIAGEHVSLPENRIVLGPNQKMEETLKIDLDESIKNANIELKINIEPTNNFTKIEPSSISIKVNVVTKMQSYVNQMKYILSELERFVSKPVLISIVVLSLSFIAFLIIGSFLYTNTYLSALKIGGKLGYSLNSQITTNQDFFEFDSMNKKKIIISFDKNNQMADFYLSGTSYKYDLTISAGIKKTRFPISSGWKTFFTRTIPVTYKITASEPGIIEKQGEFFTSKVLLEEDCFESGGYSFQYHWPDNKWNRKKKNGSNILEGKVAHNVVTSRNEDRHEEEQNI